MVLSLTVSILTWLVEAPVVGQSRAAESVQGVPGTGPSGPYNPRDLDVARPFAGRHRDEVARVLDGSVDIHMHTHPDSAERPVDAFEAARIAKSYGLRAVVLKNHHEPTAARAYLVRQVVPGIEVFGGITMDLVPRGGAGDRLGVESRDPRFQQTMPLSPGTRLGHYDVTSLLGEGGMGQVW